MDNSGHRKVEQDIGLPLYGQGCRCLLNNLPLYILLIIGIVLLFELSRARRFSIAVFPKAEKFGQGIETTGCRIIRCHSNGILSKCGGKPGIVCWAGSPRFFNLATQFRKKLRSQVDISIIHY
jgi:hypothetical protein